MSPFTKLAAVVAPPLLAVLAYTEAFQPFGISLLIILSAAVLLGLSRQKFYYFTSKRSTLGFIALPVAVCCIGVARVMAIFNQPGLVWAIYILSGLLVFALVLDALGKSSAAPKQTPPS